MPMGIVVISCVRSSVRPTIHGLGFVYCIQSAWKKWPTIWHADVSRWLTLSIHGCLWILLLVCLSVHLSVCSFTAFSGGCAFTDKSLGTNGIKFGAKEGGSDYWEMAVAITCGYGGYLLPLLAAHSSSFRYHGFPYSTVGDFLDPNIRVIRGLYCILFYRFLFSWLSSGWVVIAVCNYFSPGN